MRGDEFSKSRPVKSKGDLPFLKEMRRAVVHGKKPLVFFIGFAAFCYSSMVQMSLGVGDLASEMMSAMMLMIGLTLAFVTLFISLATVVSSNAKSVSIMRVFGYSKKECSAAVLGGYRPAALIGFIIGTFYQYILLKIAVEVIFKDLMEVPKLDFDLWAAVIAAVSFAVIYEIVIGLFSRRLSKIPIKEIMLSSE